MVQLPFLKPLRPETPSERDAYVQVALLAGVEDVFDPDLLWMPHHAFRWGSRGLKGVIDAMGSRVGEREHVPFSVQLELPADKVERDRRIGGRNCEELQTALEQRHARDFRDRLPDGLMPRYAIAAATDLRPGQVRVRLGPAIYVPDADELPAWKVQVCRDGVMWNASGPILLSEHQRLSILAGSVDRGSQVLPVWPFRADCGLVLLNLPGQDRLDLSSEPLGALEVTWNEILQCHVVREAGAPAGEGAESPCLYVKATRLQAVSLPDTPSRSQALQRPVKATRLPPAAVAAGRAEPALQPDTVDTPDSSLLADAPTMVAQMPGEPPSGQADEPGPSSSVLDDAPTLLALRPARHATLSLEGLAVQRPSLFAAAGVRGVEWGLDAAGGVVAPRSAAAGLRFTVDARDDVHVATAAGMRRLLPGEALPLKGGQYILRLESLPPPLDTHYVGWLKLPLGHPARIAHGQSVGVGRQLEALAPLRPLAGPGFLLADPGVGGDRMGLSRRHFELLPDSHGLRVTAFGNARLAHLDERMAYVAEVNADAPATLADGHCLVVGHYVWRYSA